MNLLKWRLSSYLKSFKPLSSETGDRRCAGVLDGLASLIWLSVSVSLMVHKSGLTYEVPLSSPSDIVGIQAEMIAEIEFLVCLLETESELIVPPLSGFI